MSNGGRRKYFQITDKGRKVVEQNLAEWEYSRTVIDSLISERDYDFSNPPPSSSVDFNILKKSTTRVPVGKGDEEDFIDLGEGELTRRKQNRAKQKQPFRTPVKKPRKPPPRRQTPERKSPPQSSSRKLRKPLPARGSRRKFGARTCRAGAPVQPSYAAAAETADSISQQPYAETAPQETAAGRAIPESPIAPKEEPPLSEEEKQRIHENYKVLIGDDNDATSYYYTHVAQRNREDRNTFDSTVFGNAPREEYPPQQPPMQEPAYEQPPQDLYPPQPEYYYAPAEQYGGQQMPQAAEQPAPPRGK